MVILYFFHFAPTVVTFFIKLVAGGLVAHFSLMQVYSLVPDVMVVERLDWKKWFCGQVGVIYIIHWDQEYRSVGRSCAHVAHMGTHTSSIWENAIQFINFFCFFLIDTVNFFVSEPTCKFSWESNNYYPHCVTGSTIIQYACCSFKEVLIYSK